MGHFMIYQNVMDIAGKLGWNVSLDEGRLNFCFCGKKDFSFAIFANSAVELIGKIRLLAYNYEEDQPFKDKLDELIEVLMKEM